MSSTEVKSGEPGFETAMGAAFEKRIEAYLAEKLGDGNLTVDNATRILGGGSRETWDVRIKYEVAAGVVRERDLILRLDPKESLLPSNRHTEYAVYEAFAKVPGIPVPAVLLNEDDPSYLGNPFFIMDKASGTAAPAALASPQYESGRLQIAREMMEILGRIAKADYRQIGLEDTLGAARPENVWSVQLEHWEQTLHDHQMGPHPVTEAAIRHLRRQPPPPPQRVSVVHGDYRIGNFLFSPERIEAIVDWEMAHLGDPHEDLAWAFVSIWRSNVYPQLRLFDRDEAIRLWEAASGLDVDRDALHWWELFTHVKANAIWISGAFTRKFNYSAVAWSLVDREEMWMLEDMGVVS